MTTTTSAWTSEVLARSDLAAIIATCPKPECFAYAGPLLKRAEELQTQGDSAAASVLRTLGRLCYGPLSPHKGRDPFAATLVDEGLKDRTSADLDVLLHVGLDATDPELSARILDVLWTRKKNHRAGAAACEAYLESARRLENPEDWVDAGARLDRAMDLAWALNNNDLKAKVAAHMEGALARYKGEDRSFFSTHLLEALAERDQGDAPKLAALAEHAGALAEKQPDWRKANMLWTAAARFHDRDKNREQARQARIRAAECYVGEAKGAGQHMVAAAHIQNAVEAHRRIEGGKERAEQLHRELLEHQKHIPSEMAVLSASVDVSALVRKAREAVKGKPFHVALLTLAAMYRPPSKAGLRQAVQEHVRESPLRALLHGTMVNEKGKTVAKKPSILADDPDEQEKALLAEMHTELARQQQLQVVAVLEPARQQVLLEHAFTLNDIHALVANNPMVPPGRETVWARGLCAGLEGDIMLAAHFLIPQIENSLREVLAQRGVVVSALKSDGTQPENDLGVILKKPEFTQFFGEDFTFDLEGLLVEQAGTNFRNRFAHGLLDDAALQGVASAYVWWVALALCCRPILDAKRAAAEAKKESPP